MRVEVKEFKAISFSDGTGRIELSVHADVAERALKGATIVVELPRTQREKRIDALRTRFCAYSPAAIVDAIEAADRE